MKASVSELARGSGECLEFAGSQKLVANGDGHPFARCGHECDFAGSELEGSYVSEILRDAACDGIQRGRRRLLMGRRWIG